MKPIRILTAVPICDGHDSAINTINLELIRHGIEVIYLGYHRSADDIVRAAIQEDVRAIGISSYNGGHVEFFCEVLGELRARNCQHIKLFGGGGATITKADVEQMYEAGVDQIFFAGTSLGEMVDYVQTRFAASVSLGELSDPKSDRALAAILTRIENGGPSPNSAGNRPDSNRAASRTTRLFGFTGPGGAGKTTLIDEIVARFLPAFPDRRIAILSHDPSVMGLGALLGDRATMIYSQDDRVFIRSMATRGQSGRVSLVTEQSLRFLADSEIFDAVLVETVGTGQEALPFDFVEVRLDASFLVMPPDYGSRLQLQKIAMLDAADVIVVNKSDLRGARTALAEIEARIGPNRRGQRVLRTQANRHDDPGVDRLFEILFAQKTESAVETAGATHHSF
ncbi:MAG TPA: cobalamin-dependent protein [Chthoniobacterales bacterium]|nr:cobalamin-dependent protein [Chthoniobacterales bacterium]